MCRGTENASASSASANGNKKNECSLDDEQIPLILKFWLQASRFAPTIKIAGLDFGFAFTTCLFLGALKYTVIQVLIHVFGWPADEMETVAKAAACLVPIVHSGSLVPSLWVCLRSHKYSPSARFDGTF